MRNILRKALLVTPCLMLLGSQPVRADLKYEETTKITGGMMQSMSKVMGVFGMKGMNNMGTANFLKGDCMRTDHFMGNELTTTDIVCIDRDQIISIDHKKKTYSVITFEQMREQMEKAMQEAMQRRSQMGEAQKQPPPSDVKVEPKLTVKDTGETKVINGYNAKRYLMSFELETQNQQNKDQGSMGMDGDVWMSKDVGSFEERTAFYAKYTQKMASPEMAEKMRELSLGLQDPRMGQGLGAMKQHVDKMEGVAVLTIASFKVSGTSSQPNQQPGSSQTQQQQKPSSSETSADSQSISGNLGKVFGGLGGFGRKKKKADEPQAADTSQSGPASSSSGAPASMDLMQITTELKSVSRAGLDSSIFELPKGYKLDQSKGR
jgi:hypothetical protein